MSRSIVVEGKTSTEAIEKGLKELKVSKNQVEIKILEEKKKSFFNILDPHVVKVEITVKEGSMNEEKVIEKKEPYSKKLVSAEDIEIAKNRVNLFLDDFLNNISKKINYEIKVNDNIIYVTIFGEESTKLIGYRGEALNSLQVILATIANREKESNIKIILDIGDYKSVRKKTLEELADKIEKTVTRTGKTVTLEPMTAYERKIIHTRLQESKNVKTYSIGEADRRRVVITKK